MEYVVTVTYLHRRLVAGIPKKPNVKRIHVQLARNSDRWAAIRRLPKACWQLLRCALDGNSVVYIAHPFHPIFALYARVARTIILYDDGTAYYIGSHLPANFATKVYKKLAAKHFAWTGEDGAAVQSFPEMLAQSRAAGIFAIYPALMPKLNIPIQPIDLSLAFPNRGPLLIEDEAPCALFLDTGRDMSPQGEAAAEVVKFLQSEQRAARSTLFYKSHPTGDSQIGRILAEQSWAKRLSGPLEGILEERAFAKVYSFYSSGAVTAKIINPQTEIVNIDRGGMTKAAPECRSFFERLGANEAIL